MKKINLFSPAKINLFFHVVNTRSDGFHNIASIMQAISLGDGLSISVSDKDSYSCNAPSLLWNPQNLIYKALESFRKKAQIREPLQIIHTKMIPMQAGLGGGSSNAATILWGVNELFHRPLQQSELIELAGQLGSDIAFFLSLGSAFCQSRGEIFYPIKPIPLQGWLAIPHFGMCTKQVFTVYDTHVSHRHTLSEVLNSYAVGDNIFYNDLQEAAFFLNPQMQNIQNRLQKMGFSHVVMTGSGSTFFCLGGRKPILFNNVKFYPFSCIYRNKQSWYQLYEQTLT